MAAMNENDPKRPVVPPEDQDAFDQIMGAAAHWVFRREVVVKALRYEDEHVNLQIAEKKARDDFIDVVKAMLSQSHAGQMKLHTDAQIARGWRDTFSTENPFCPCDLKSFTKAVHWAERRWAK